MYTTSNLKVRSMGVGIGIADCWCKVFDGSKFIKGSRSQGLCCTRENMGKARTCESKYGAKVDHCGQYLHY